MSQRIIVHLDMNSYFATVEQQDHPEWRGKPLGVAGKAGTERTVITGASIEAKKYGLYSGISTWEAKKLCPSLIIAPPRYWRYKELSQQLFQALERWTPDVEVFSIDECWLDLTSLADWEGAQTMARQMKSYIKNNLGDYLSCSIGISYGKVLAKLASELQKPDGLTVIRPDNFAAVSAKTPISDLCGVGWRLTPRLKRLGVRTLADLATIDRVTLIKIFGEHTGVWLNRISHGYDDNQVRSWRSLAQEKSIGHSYTLPRDINTHEEISSTVRWLAERVGERLRGHQMLARSLSVYVRSFDRSGWGNFTMTKESFDDSQTLARLAQQLISQRPEAKPIRLIGLTAGELVNQKQATAWLLDHNRRQERLTKATDKINGKFGRWSIFPAVISQAQRHLQILPDSRPGRNFKPEDE